MKEHPPKIPPHKIKLENSGWHLREMQPWKYSSGKWTMDKNYKFIGWIESDKTSWHKKSCDTIVLFEKENGEEVWFHCTRLPVYIWWGWTADEYFDMIYSNE